MGEFVVLDRIRFIAARRHVKIMHAIAAGQACSDMARVALGAEFTLFDILQRQF